MWLQFGYGQRTIKSLLSVKLFPDGFHTSVLIPSSADAKNQDLSCHALSIVSSVLKLARIFILIDYYSLVKAYILPRLEFIAHLLKTSDLVKPQ
jgi:hypothetical protein